MTTPDQDKAERDEAEMRARVNSGISRTMVHNDRQFVRHCLRPLLISAAVVSILLAGAWLYAGRPELWPYIAFAVGAFLDFAGQR